MEVYNILEMYSNAILYLSRRIDTGFRLLRFGTGIPDGRRFLTVFILVLVISALLARRTLLATANCSDLGSAFADEYRLVLIGILETWISLGNCLFEVIVCSFCCCYCC